MRSSCALLCLSKPLCLGWECTPRRTAGARPQSLTPREEGPLRPSKPRGAECRNESPWGERANVCDQRTVSHRHPQTASCIRTVPLHLSPGHKMSVFSFSLEPFVFLLTFLLVTVARCSRVPLGQMLSLLRVAFQGCGHGWRQLLLWLSESAVIIPLPCH